MKAIEYENYKFLLCNIQGQIAHNQACGSGFGFGFSDKLDSDPIRPPESRSATPCTYYPMSN